MVFAIGFTRNNMTVALLYVIYYFFAMFKANVSQKILNWHSLRHSHSAEICIHSYCLS